MRTVTPRVSVFGRPRWSGPRRLAGGLRSAEAQAEPKESDSAADPEYQEQPRRQMVGMHLLQPSRAEGELQGHHRAKESHHQTEQQDLQPDQPVGALERPQLEVGRKRRRWDG